MSSDNPVLTGTGERLFLLVLAGIQFTHILDFMIMMPLGPQLMRALGITPQQFGLLLSSYTFTAAASGLFAAAFVDRFDRRKLILAIYVLFVLATLSCGFAPNYSALLLARALAGAFGGLLGGLVHTMIADVVPFERRGQAMGTIMAAFSLSTVAGVPLGLFLASYHDAIGWRMPFFFIVVVAVVILGLGIRFLPSLTHHLQEKRVGNIAQQLYAVFSEPNHLRAYLFVSLLMLTSFSVIPYIALYYTVNLGVSESFISLLYLCGGAATLVTARMIGKLADRKGKLRVFQWIAIASFVPLLITTHLVPVPGWVVLLNSTLFFILVSGRMIPGMALATASAAPQVRGTFMSLGGSVQMMSSGLASLIASFIITRDASGQLMNYHIVGYFAVACGLLSLFAAKHLRAVTAEEPR